MEQLLRLLCRIPASLSIMITLYHHSVYHDHSASHHCTISLHSVSAPCMCVRRHTRCSTEVSPRPALLCPAWPSVTGGCSAVWCGPSTITSTGTSCTAPTTQQCSGPYQRKQEEGETVATLSLGDVSRAAKEPSRRLFNVLQSRKRPLLEHSPG